jgi:rare lipoprotein A
MIHMTMKYRIATIIVLAALALAGCRPSETAARDQVTETGKASWYGHPFHGRKTASGEIYDMEQLTAAHRVLPFGSVVRITNISNGKTVDVRINDRGPFVEDRIIDLSHASAVRLKISGVGEVSLQPLTIPRTRGDNNFAVQVGIFDSEQKADSIKEKMAGKYGIAKIVLRDGDPQTWRVIVGSEPTVELANSLGEKIRAETNTGYFVVALDSE